MRKNHEKPCITAEKCGENNLGRVVLSLAGRDRGKYFIAVGVYDGEHLMLADGCLRRIEKPKKKKLRHIRLLAFCAPELKEKLTAGKPVLNAELRKALAACKTDLGSRD